MQVERMSTTDRAAIPLMAALPYAIRADEAADGRSSYDPKSQLTVYAGRNFSTCREDESAGHLFQSKSDTKKDD